MDFFLLCAAASGISLITGLADIDGDRRDASKREQPFANGRISIFAGFAVAVALIAWRYVVPAVVMLWLLRIWLLSHRMQLDDDPIAFALKDLLSWLLGTVILVAAALAI